jgi:putative flippase GtrA
MKAVLDKFWRYFITGGIAAIVDIAGFAGLIAAGLASAPAAALSFAVAITLNYVLTNRFVYGCRLQWRRYLRFLGTTLLGLAVNVSVTLAAFHVAGLPSMAAKTVGLGLAFLCNFTMVHFLIYARERPEG